jgi:hypothetical protein
MNTRITSRWLLGAALGLALVLAVACADSPSDSPDEGSAGGPAATDSGAPRDDSFTGDDAEAPPTGGLSSGEAYDSAGALPAMLDRKIIRTATLSVNVDAVSEKFEEMSNIALGAGGFVSSSSFGNRGESQTASVTIRVPADQYDSTLRRLRDLGDVKEEGSNANDVTEQFTDLESRLRNLQASEQRYLEFLDRAANITEVLTVQDRINTTRAEIEQIQGRMQLLTNQSDLATITVHLLPLGVSPDGGANSPLEVAQEAFEASLVVLLGIAMVAIAVAAFSWWLVPLALGGWYLGRKQLRSTRSQQS